MKISETDDHCGECSLIGYCGDPCELPHLCYDERFKDTNPETYIRLAEMSKAGAGIDDRNKFLEAISDDVYRKLRRANKC